MNRKKVLTALAVAGLGIGPVACGGDAAPDEQAALDREMDLAMAEDSAAPELADVPDDQAPATTQGAAQPQAQRPRAQAPQPSPTPSPAAEAAAEPAPEPGPSYEEVGVAQGTQLVVTLNQELSTKNNAVGDVWSATVQEPITKGRRVIIPAGAKVVGEVTAVQESKGSGQPAVLKLTVDELSFDGQRYPIKASVIEANPETKGRQSTGEKAAKIGGGGALGAIVGGVISGSATGAIIGGAIGAAAGTAITLGTEDVDAVLPKGSVMKLQVDRRFTVRFET